MLRDTLLLTISKLIVALVAFFINWYLARILVPEEFGVYSLLLNYVNFLGILFLMGTNVSHVYYKNKGVNNFKALISIYGLLLIAFSLFYIVFSGKYVVFLVIANSLLLASFSLLNSDAQADGKFLTYAKQIIFYSIGGAAFVFIGVFYFYFDEGQEIMVLSFTGSFFTFILLSYSKYTYKAYNVKLKKTKEFLKYGANGFFLNLQGQALYFADLIIIGAIMGAEDVAIYSVAALIAKVMWLFIDTIGIVLFPKIINGKYNEKLKKVNLAIFQTFIICLIPAVIFVIFGLEGVIFAFGEQYESSFYLAKILVVSSFPLILYKISSRLVASESMWRIAHIALFISLLVNIILNIISIPALGLIGAAYSSLISYAICGLYIYFKVCSHNAKSR
ncbi:oligosaccharide flippase family protein [Pseudoalteromonas lipolytica]|uniref:oligosaccharide flippase family protein n=1 Tax=Pseudoalteromonas lipolytica TaxID=570156 RepID=UPI003B9E67A0